MCDIYIKVSSGKDGKYAWWGISESNGNNKNYIEMLEIEVIVTKIKNYFVKLISCLIIVEERIWKRS